MDERRKGPRDKVILGGVAASPDGVTKDCVVRNLSDYGARVEFKNGIRPPLDKMALTIARKGKSFVAKIIWLRDNIVGIAFTDPPVAARPDLEERLRKSEKKKRQLQRRIKELLGEG